jgi:hypothetical protein
MADLMVRCFLERLPSQVIRIEPGRGHFLAMFERGAVYNHYRSFSSGFFLALHSCVILRTSEVAVMVGQ